mgnify:CR=1 FL=1
MATRSRWRRRRSGCSCRADAGRLVRATPRNRASIAAIPAVAVSAAAVVHVEPVATAGVTVEPPTAGGTPRSRDSDQADRKQLFGPAPAEGRQPQEDGSACHGGADPLDESPDPFGKAGAVVGHGRFQCVRQCVAGTRPSVQRGGLCARARSPDCASRARGDGFALRQAGTSFTSSGRPDQSQASVVRETPSSSSKGRTSCLSIGARARKPPPALPLYNGRSKGASDAASGSWRYVVEAGLDAGQAAFIAAAVSLLVDRPGRTCGAARQRRAGWVDGVAS